MVGGGIGEVSTYVVDQLMAVEICPVELFHVFGMDPAAVYPADEHCVSEQGVAVSAYGAVLVFCVKAIAPVAAFGLIVPEGFCVAGVGDEKIAVLGRERVGLSAGTGGGAKDHCNGNRQGEN